MPLLVLEVVGLVAGAVYNALLAYEAVTLDIRPRRLRAFGSCITAAILLGVAVYLVHSYGPGSLSVIN